MHNIAVGIGRQPVPSESRLTETHTEQVDLKQVHTVSASIQYEPASSDRHPPVPRRKQVGIEPASETARKNARSESEHTPNPALLSSESKAGTESQNADYPHEPASGTARFLPHVRSRSFSKNERSKWSAIFSLPIYGPKPETIKKKERKRALPVRQNPRRQTHNPVSYAPG